MKRINTSFWRISLFLWLLCLPLATFAEDFINKEGAMMAYQGSSQSSIKMKIMFDDWGSRHYYVDKLTVYAKYTDAKNNLKVEPLVFLRSGSSYYDEEAKNVINIGCNGYAHYYDNDYQAPTLWCGIQALKGTVVVTNGYGGSFTSDDKNTFHGSASYSLRSDVGRQTACWINNVSRRGQVSAELEWFAPVDMAGATKMQLYANYECSGASDNNARLLSTSEFSIQNQETIINILDPMLSTDDLHPNKIAVNYYTTQSLTGNISCTWNEDSIRGPQRTMAVTETPANNFGTIYLDADKEYYNFKIKGNYKYNSGSNPTLTESVPYAYIPSYRQIKFAAAPAMAFDNQGSVNLKFKLERPEGKDIWDNIDFVEVERAFSPDFSDAESIGTFTLESGEAEYTLKDSSNVLLQHYNKTSSDWVPDYPKVYYRIARSSSQIWSNRGWATDSVTLLYTYGYITPTYYSPVLNKSKDWDKNHTALFAIPKEHICHKDSVPTRDGSAYVDVIWNEEVAKWVLNYQGLYKDAEGNPKTVEFSQDISLEELLSGDSIKVLLERPCMQYKDFKLCCVPQEGSGQLTRLHSMDWSLETYHIKDKFYYDSAGKVGNLQASRGYYSNKVNLQWETDGGNIDRYTLERRKYTLYGATWQVIASNLTEQFYTDTRITPGTIYEYRVKALCECNATVIENISDICYGYASATGTVDGYVRFPDGNGVPNVEVIVDGESLVDGNKVAIFDGTGPYATSYYVASENTTPQPQSFTVQMWVKPQDIRNEITLFRFGDYKLQLQPHEWYNTFRYSKSFKVRGSEGESVLAPAREYIYSNTFYHITVTYDAVTDSIKFYQNGNLAHVMQSTVKPASTGQPAYLELGGEATFLNNRQLIALDNYLMHGQCVYDDVRLWNRALSPSEIKQNYSRILGGSEKGLMLYWRFDEHDFSASNPLSKRIADYTRNGEYDVQHMDGIVYRRRTDMGTQVIDGKTYYNCEEKDLKGGMASENGLGTDKLWYKGLTNETGYYRISGLPVQGETTYTLTPQSASGQKFSPDGGISVTFDGTNYEKNNYNFDLTSYYMLSGTVLYEGSSIPVRQASFLVNGSELQRNGKAVTTNDQGEFEFYVPRGVNTVQVVKDGHTFMNDGYLLDEEGDKHYNFERPVYEVRFWDETKVKLMGRMVGGMTEGGKPLGRSLSVNNLGDSLRLVLQLEGDNTSWIVKDQLDDEVRTRHKEFTHLNAAYSNAVDYERHRIIIRPNEQTGEYIAELYPVQYKVVEASAEGYTTLFQEGKVGETLDLTNALELVDSTATYVVDKDTLTDTVSYNAIYDRIYRSEAKVTYKQINYNNQSHFGITKYEAANMAGDKATVPLYDATAKTYTFGYPVFQAGDFYAFEVSAHEDYYYNNDVLGKYSSSPLAGTKVKVHNGFYAENKDVSVTLDSLGKSKIQVPVTNVTYTQTGTDALRSFSISATLENRTIESDVLRAYVLGGKQKPGGKIITSEPNACLMDILRDPPGSGSKATLKQGTSYNYSYKFNFDVKAGIDFSISSGGGMNKYSGIVGPTVTTGDYYSSSKNVGFNLNIVSGYHLDKNSSLKISTSQDISTSSSQAMVGKNADVYIGAMQAMVITPMLSVRAIDDKMYQQMRGSELGKTLKVISSSVAENGNKYYLVSDESLNVGTDFTSDFVYTGYYIEKTLIPNLIAQRDQLLFTGTRTEAKQMAEKLKAPVYWSCKPAGDKEFGSLNSIVVAGEDSILTYNTTCDTVSYMIIEPDNYQPETRYDKVYNINKSIMTWVGFLTRNEIEKIGANEKINTISFSGETSISYSETYQGDVNTSRYIITPTGFKGDLPFVNGLDFIRKLAKIYDNRQSANKDESIYELQFFGFNIKLSLTPVFELSVGNPANGAFTESRSRTVSYTLSANRRSNLTVDVLRASVARDSLASYVKNGWAAEADEYSRFMENLHDEVDNGGAASFYDENARYYSGIIFRTVGGATCCPYEDEYRPQYYNSNQVINAKTKQVEKPVIHVEQRSVSNVPIDKPAIFNLRFTNEAEVPDPNQVGFNLYLSNNPKGAKVLIDGEAITDGYPMVIPAGQASYRTLEVWAGQDFDYDDLTLQVISGCDPSVSTKAAISAHFVPSAGEINITTPENKWVMNTESPQEDGRYYLPVRIDKYNVNQRGFDHIELQYKLTNKPEKDWVNICSYYADSTLYAAAGGTKEMLGTNGYISARFFGETDPTEQLYDLRAVTYCRYGTGFVTSSTPVLSGVKDTRRPAPFGNTQPANGVLTAADDIKIIFSEDIAGNYLSKVNNFDVTGYLNSSEITQSTSLHFDGSTYAATNVKRNLSNKDFTIELLAYPEATHRDMTLFSHTGDDGRFALRLTGDNRLQAMVLGKDTAIVTSDEQLLFKGFTQLAATFDAGTHRLRLYQGNKALAANRDTIPPYLQTGRLCFGAADPTGKDMSDAYVGNMLEARLWNKVLGPAELNQMSFKRLSGYEAGLVDYYPMNEGTGTTLHDKGQGATALLNAASWTLPKGMSAKLDGTADGIHLDERYFSRTATQDYTLSFWFKTASRDTMALLCNGRADSTDTDAENKFYIGLENGRPVYRSGKREARIDRDYSDGQWHHYALTVNRPRNLVNIFVDNALMTTFSVDSLGGFSSPRTYIGACHTLTEAEEGGFTDNVTDRFEGNVDDVMLWSAALPPTVISDIYNVNPNGDEMALVAWLPFSRSEKQMDNTYKLNFTPLSAKRYKDPFGNYTSRVDTLIIGDASMLADKKDFAPMRDLGLKENVKFSYAAKNDQLIVNLDVPDKEIEGTTVYVTVKDVTDLNGNEMASPVMMWVYVNRNDLKWENNQIKQEFDYEWKEYMQFTTTIHNKGGKRRHFRLEGMPDWLTVTPIEGNVTALGSQDISFSINQSINPGTYDEVIYLVNDNGVAEPLALTIKVNPIRPDWSVNMDKSENSMSICGQIRINGKISTDSDDMVGVFCGKECIGVAHNSVDNVTGDSHVFLTVYGTSGTADPLTFYIWDSGTGAIYQAMLTEDGKPGTVFKFAANALHGTLQNPLIIEGGDILQQSIQLHAGCNWVSFAVKSPSKTKSYTLGDVIKLLLPENRNTVLDFNIGKAVTCIKGDRVTYKEEEDLKIPVDNKHLFKIKVRTPQTMRISGLLLQQTDECTINLLPGWNGIGFTPIVNLPISEALADYYDEAADGDIIKSQNEFAIFSDDGAGHRLWRGNLSYLKAGEGYMMKRTAATPASFTYPVLQTNGSYALASPQQMRGTETGAAFRNPYASSMTMVAQVTGIDLEPGDRLAAYAGSELRGIATAAPDGRFYLSIGGDMAEALRMELLRGETTVAQTASPVGYTVNAVSGTYLAPTQINFASAAGCKAGPNPFDKFIDFSAAAPAGTEVTFAVYSLGGTLVHRYQATADAPLTNYRWMGAAALAEGVYIATITYNGESHSFKLIKQ